MSNVKKEVKEEASGSGQQKEWTIVAPGPIHANKRLAVARFLQALPDWKDPNMAWRIVPEKPEGVRRNQPRDPMRVPWLLEKRPGEVAQKGVLDVGLGGGIQKLASKGAAAGGGSTNLSTSAHTTFVMVQQGDVLTAFPADLVHNFKTVFPRHGATTIEEAEAAMRRGRDVEATGSEFFAPKSVRAAVAKGAEEGDAPAAARRGGGGGGGGGGGRDDKMMNLFGSDSDDDGDNDDDLGLDKKATKGRGGGGGGGGRGGRGGGGGGEDGGLGDDAVEDIYQGEQDELRPDKPEAGEDWEHEFEFADDDEVMEVDDQKEEDDPGERKKLGLEEDEEDDDEDARRLKEKLDDSDEDGEDANAPVEPAPRVDGDDDDEDLDEMAQGELNGAASLGAGAGASKVKPEAKAEGGGGGGGGVARMRTPTPPPPGAGDAGAVGVPPGADKAQAAAATAQAQAQAGAKRKAPETSPAAPAPAKRAKEPAAPAAAASAGGGGVTQDDVVAALKGAAGRMSLPQLKTLFQAKLKAAGAVDVLKTIVRHVGRLDKGPDGAYVVLKAAFGGPP
ncbi:hypothetical protein FOA52_003038 [Chlamydomonas sp. UWO 241]|nr:hypothetical protein FOA52_003038 [Chlamydomonas sp. UWO 241]